MSGEELVVLLGDNGQEIGCRDKASVHTEQTPLHSAFSVFLFDGLGNMLVQRRASSKKTWGGVWSNACCGHPAPGELLIDAAHRRLKQELGIEGIDLEVALPDFRYKAKWKGVWENEICPVLIGCCPKGVLLSLNALEVSTVEWVSWNRFVRGCSESGNCEYVHFSPWCKMEALLLAKSQVVEKMLKEAA